MAFETGSCYIAQAGLKLLIFCISILTARIMGMATRPIERMVLIPKITALLQGSIRMLNT